MVVTMFPLQYYSTVLLVVNLLLLATVGSTWGYTQSPVTDYSPGTINVSHRGDSGSSLAAGSNDCPPWFVQEKKNNCTCGDDLGGLIICNATYDPDFRWSLYILLGQIMTYDNVSNRTLVITSPYNTFNGWENLNQLHVKIDVDSVDDLNNNTCGRLNREGVHCSRCQSGYGPSVFTLDLKCYKCAGLYHGWALYLAMEILPLTVFFLIIVALQIKPTSGNLNSYVLFSQIVAFQLTFGTELAFEYSLKKTSTVLVRILQICYGFWNLDFFRPVIPSFCVSSSMNNLQVLLLQYISVFYPMTLVLIGWICCVLHERNVRLIVWAWRPFKRYLSHFSVTSNPKRSIMNIFATFLILSYSKLLFVSANLMNKVPVFSSDKQFDSRIFFDPMFKPYQGGHIPYVFISLFIFTTFIAIPPLVLLLYQLKSFQTHVLKKCCPQSHIIQMFADSFQNCFKDGTNTTIDCRFFAGAYLVFRTALFLAGTAIDNHVAQWIIHAFIFFIATVLIAVFRPYRKAPYNWLDGTLCAMFAIGAIFLSVSSFHQVDPKFKVFMFIFAFMAVSAPLLYMIVYIVYKCAKYLRFLKPLTHLRRRGYEEISEYGYDSDYDWEKSREKDHRYLEIGSTNSFQSE